MSEIVGGVVGNGLVIWALMVTPFNALALILFNVQDAPLGLGVSVTACIFLVMLLKHKPGRAKEAAILPPPPPPPPMADGEIGREKFLNSRLRLTSPRTLLHD